MKILVIGGGGREHAICYAIQKSRPNAEVFCAPGNAGIARIAQCVALQPTKVAALADFASLNKIDLTFVGGESALAAGIVDEFECRHLKIVGASQKAARLESSKIFAKDFMTRHRIPTAKYFTADSVTAAIEILENGTFGTETSPVVVKADGLAAGKGVVVAQNRAEAISAIKEMMISGSVGAEAARRILLEEVLIGREVSLLLFADGKNFRLMPPVRDHKRIGENDTGANTGGMGTICDNSLLSDTELNKIVAEIVEPTLSGAAAENLAFRGVLFLGLMLTASGAKLLEYNVRFGDPEAQSILVRLDSDFLEICEAILNEKLPGTEVKFSNQSSACVVMAARGYPAKPTVGDVISGLKEAAETENVTIFHAATQFDENNNFITAGGRVLGVTAVGENLNVALANAYRAVNKITWDGVQFRRDIGNLC
jgi:phosphoribosylamine--glycine ligase